MWQPMFINRQFYEIPKEKNSQNPISCGERKAHLISKVDVCNVQILLIPDIRRVIVVPHTHAHRRDPRSTEPSQWNSHVPPKIKIKINMDWNEINIKVIWSYASRCLHGNRYFALDSVLMSRIPARCPISQSLDFNAAQFQTQLNARLSESIIDY